MNRREVLIIDDEPIVLRTLKRSLADYDVSVVTTPCTAEARAMLKHRSFGVIICDQNMPGETGLEFLTEIRSHHPEIACFMLSGLVAGLEVAEKWAAEIGVRQIFSKPCDTQRLAEAIQEALAEPSSSQNALETTTGHQ
ncbi:MAG: response regulator [Planctomycetota bacterium]